MFLFFKEYFKRLSLCAKQKSVNQSYLLDLQE